MYWRTNARDLFFFCTAILKTAWEGDKFNNFGRIHRALCSFIDPGKPKNRRMFISMFRGSFKSTIILGMCLYLFTWAVVEGKSLSIVYNTATKENASAFMEDFRTTLIECKFLQWIFPELPNSIDQFQSWHLFRLEYKKVKFHVSSLDTQQVGRHYQIIINDDLVNDTNAFSETERKNVKRKWSLQKAILTKYRKFGIAMEIEVGTPYHKHDLVSHIMKNSRGYEKFIIPYAIKNKAGKLVLSFPEMFSWEDFEERRVDMGESLFATQYRLCVLDETDKLADEEWLKDWADLPDNYTRYLIIDPAGTENKKRNDPTGFLVFDIDERGYYYIRYCEESWLPPAKGLKHAEYIANRFGTDENYFEKEKYSISIASTAEYITPSFTFGLIDHKNEPPEKRIHRLKQFFETGRILFGPGQEALKRQITGYPDIEHDDLLNCLAHAIRQAQLPKRGLKRDHEDGKEKDFCDQMAEAQARMKRITQGPSMDAYF